MPGLERADAPAHKRSAWLAALAGAVTVGVIHARQWRYDRWAGTPDPQGANHDGRLSGHRFHQLARTLSH